MKLRTRKPGRAVTGHAVDVMAAAGSASTVRDVLPVGSAGLPVPWHVATTADLPALYPCQTDEGLGGTGTLLGWDVLAGGGTFCFDPFDLYARGLVTGPNMLVVGQIGRGKSTFVKLFIDRTVGNFRSPDGSPRWTAIIDPKGEYGPLAARLGLTVIRLAPGGGTVVNPLDPGPAVRTSVELVNCRIEAVSSMLVSQLRRELSEIEQSAVGWAVTEVTRGAGEPVLADVVGLFGEPTEQMCGHGRRTASVLAAELDDARLCLGRLLSGRLAGMFDGPSTARPDWGGRGFVVDLSGVWHDKPALSLAMLSVMSWLQQLFAVNEGRYCYLVLDEAWSLLGDPAMARALQGFHKFSRKLGVSVWQVLHNLSGLGSQADTGTATEKIATSLLADTEIRLIFAQPDSELLPPPRGAGGAERLGLEEKEARDVPDLPWGRALVAVGSRYRGVVQLHMDEPGDWAFCDTDAAMRDRPA